MERSRSPRRNDGDASLNKPIKEDVDSDTSKGLVERVKKMEMKPPSAPMSMLAKSTVLLPTGIARVQQPSPNLVATSSGSATGNPRNKTALAPGHSLMDWIRLGSSGVDLTGVGGALLSVTPAELARHNKENDAWIAIRGIVFNVSRYMNFHPGGIPELMKGVGKDATKLFDDVHAWVNYQSILQKCVVGKLERTSSSAAELTSLFEPENSKSKARSDSRKESIKQETVQEPANVEMDWRQTSKTITFFYSIPTENLATEYRLQRTSDSQYRVQFCLENDGIIVTHDLKLSQDTEWPPTWKKDGKPSEVEFTFTKKQTGLWKSYGMYESSEEPIQMKERRYREYTVLENIPMCKTVNLLTLRAENYLQVVPVGRHVEVKMDVMGTEVSRSYTPVPMCLRPEDKPTISTDDCLYLMVKRYPDGALSPSITSLQPGQTLTLSNALGTFAVETFDTFRKMHMLAAGTGLTAMLGNIHRAIRKRNAPTINLISFNRNQDNVFYAEQLDRVCQERALTVVNVISQPEEPWEGRRGTVSDDLLKELIGTCCPTACVFTCGPPAFMEAASRSLQHLGWKPSQIHEFND